MKIIISFLVGVWFAWGFLKNYDSNVFDLWTEAYSVGKDGSNMSDLVWWLIAVCVVILGSIQF